MDFPIIGLLDPSACYQALLGWLHPGGLACPRCGARDGLAVHRRHRDPVTDYRCDRCGRVFNAFTGTALQGTHRRPAEIVLVLRGVVRGEPTARLARELHASRPHLLELRHRLQDNARRAAERAPLPDTRVEADEMFQNAGKKGRPHQDPADPPRRRANKGQGHGTWDNDRPPVVGVVGRETGRLRLCLVKRMWAACLAGFVVAVTRPGAHVSTDEWGAYDGLPAWGRRHGSVHHGGARRGDRREWARDDDGDGIREVHCNTLEGIWTGLRTFLRPFRGVSKWDLSGYVAVFQWGYNLKEPNPASLRALLGCLGTDIGT